MPLLLSEEENMRDLLYCVVGLGTTYSIMTNLGSDKEPPRLGNLLVDLCTMCILVASALLDALAAAAW